MLEESNPAEFDPKTSVSAIIVTTGAPESLRGVSTLLESLARQKMVPSETFVVAHHHSSELSNLNAVFPSARILVCDRGKAASRNVGTEAASGHYVLHLDDDYELDPNVTMSCVQVASQNRYGAVIIPECLKYARHFQAARQMERRLYDGDPFIEAPRCFARQTLQDIGGFEPRLDPIDEGSIKEKLTVKGISIGHITSPIYVSDTRSLWAQMKDKFERGKRARLFETMFPASLQTHPVSRLRYYAKRLRKLAGENPFTFVQMVFCKTIDLAAFLAGRLSTPSVTRLEIASIQNARIFESEGATYQTVFYEKTLGARTVDEREKKLVLELLNGVDRNAPIHVLDMGSGGGRWSELVLCEFPQSVVTTCDLSETMLQTATRRLARFGDRVRIVRGDFANLPLADGSIDMIVCIRAIKYARSTLEALREFHRVLVPDGLLVLEVPFSNVILRSLTILPIGAIGEYARRIRVLSQDALEKLLHAERFNIILSQQAFTLPASLYSHKLIDSRFAVVVCNGVERILPMKWFARSVFVKAIRHQIV